MHSKLDYYNLILNQTVFNTSNILSHVLFSGPQSTCISTLLSNLYNGLQEIHQEMR